jgi:hypothetical protein
MILGVGLEVRVPNSLIAEHDLSVYEGGDLSVAAAEVEADAAAIEMAAKGSSAAPFGRQLIRMHDFDGMIEHTFANDFGVEFAGGSFAVMRGEPGGQIGRSLEMKAKTAARPKQELGEAFEVSEIARGSRGGAGEDLGGKMGHVAVGLLKRQADWNRIGGGFHAGAKGAIGQNRRPKSGIENRLDSGRDQGQSVIIVHLATAF